jgi:hypothetical protein
MPEDDPLAVERAATNRGHQAGQSLGRVDRVGEDPLGRREQTGGLLGLGCRYAIPATKRAVIDDDRGLGNCGDPGKCCELIQDLGDPGPQVRARVGGRDAKNPCREPGGRQPREEPGLRATARRR